MTLFFFYSFLHLVLFILFYKKKKLGISLLFFYSAFNFLISLYLAEDQRLISFLYDSLNCNILILVGYYIFKYNQLRSIKIDFKKDIQIINKVIFIFLVLIFYHYFITGIPFLSENLDQNRFLLITSGLFGIPSRISVYGLVTIFILIIFSFEFKAYSKKKIFLLSTIFLLFVLSQSNKSSVLQIFYYFMILYPFLEITKKQIYNAKNFFLICTVSFIYFIFVFDQLSTISNVSIKDYIIMRSTYIGFDPGLYLINLNISDFNLKFNNPILNDLFYPFYKLIGSDILTVTNQLSLKMFGINEDNFILPITPHWFGYHYFLFNNSIIYVYIYSFLLGILVAKIENKSFRTSSWVLRTAILSFLYWIWIGYQSGNVYYIIFNSLIVITIFYFIYYYFRQKKYI